MSARLWLVPLLLTPSVLSGQDPPERPERPEGLADLSGIRYAEIWVRARPDAPRCVEAEYTDLWRRHQIGSE